MLTMVATPANENALNQRQTAAEERDAQGLQQGCHTTHEQAGGHQQTGIGSRHASRFSHDQRHRHDAAVHGQHMLQAIHEVGGDAKILIFGALDGRIPGCSGLIVHLCLLNYLLTKALEAFRSVRSTCSNFFGSDLFRSPQRGLVLQPVALLRERSDL
jgi:hypothetical protein